MALETIANEFRAGTYRCVECQSLLYSSADKFKTNLKWAAFRKAANEGAVRVEEEVMSEEIYCNKCGKHVGSLFHDGKKQGDEHAEAKDRHLVLSVAVNFEATDPNEPAPQLPEESAIATHTLTVNEALEKPASPPLGVANPSSNGLRSSGAKPKAKSSAPSTPSTSSKDALRSSSNNKLKKSSNITQSSTSDASTKSSSPLSKTTLAVVGVITVAVVGVVGWLGYRAVSNNKKQKK